MFPFIFAQDILDITSTFDTEEHICRQRWQYDDEPTENVEGDGRMLRVAHAVHCRAQVVPASAE